MGLDNGGEKSWHSNCESETLIGSSCHLTVTFELLCEIYVLCQRWSMWTRYFTLMDHKGSRGENKTVKLIMEEPDPVAFLAISP